MTYLVMLFLIVLALIPPIDFFIRRPENDVWFVIVLLMGFFSFYTIFIRTESFVKIVAIWSFIQAVLCADPLIGLTAYASVILCVYLYIFASRIDDWTPVFKLFQTLLFLNMAMIVLQMSGRDALLNFGRGHDLNTYGIVGQHMQMGSYSVVLAALLLPFSAGNMVFPFVSAFFCNSSWTLVCVAAGIYTLLFDRYRRAGHVLVILILLAFSIFAVKTDKISANISPESGRLQVWGKSLQLAMKHPLIGWGPGTYKVDFPTLEYNAGARHLPYITAHNWLIQMIFEMGIPFSLYLCWLLGLLATRLYAARRWTPLAGIAMILLDMTVHFPDRMLQTVGMIIVFLAYCQAQLRAVDGQIK